MSLASNMTQLTEKLEAAQEARLSAVYEDLAEVMAEHARRVDSDLKGIFSQAAIIRGRADDLIDGFAAERRSSGQRQRGELAEFASGLRAFVDELMDGYASDRETMSAREAANRADYLADLRARVEVTLAEAEDFVGALREDRSRANRIWQQHARKQRKHRADKSSSKAAVLRAKTSLKPKAAKPAGAASKPAIATSKSTGAAAKPGSAAPKSEDTSPKPDGDQAAG